MKKQISPKRMRQARDSYFYERTMINKEFHVKLSQKLKKFHLKLHHQFIKYLNPWLLDAFIRRIKRLELIAERHGYEMVMENWKGNYAFWFTKTD